MYDKSALKLYIETHFIDEAKLCAAPCDAMASAPKKLSRKKRALFFAVEREAGSFRPNAPKKTETDAVRPEAFLSGAHEEATDEQATALPMGYVSSDELSLHSVPAYGAAPTFELDESFRDALLRLIDEKGYRDPEVYKRAGMDRRHFGKIKNDFDNKYRPSKKTALALAISLGLTLPETEDFIRRAGYSLSRSILSDVIVSYFLENGVTDIDTINEALYDADQQTLSE
ncbi:MAG: hypothetical protein IKX91_02865 [Firmicutes bacterium]|nr:hypothetical protein [Bacillota bacterium]